MSEVRTGAGPWLVSNEIETDLKNGGSYNTDIWEGTETECRTKRTATIAGGATRIRLGPKGDGSWQLRASYPFDPEGQNSGYVDVMELEVNAIQRSAYQSPQYRWLFSDYVGASQSSAKANSTLPLIGDCARKYQSGLPKRESSGSYLFDGTGYATRELAIQAELNLRLDDLTTLTVNERAYAGALFENIAYRGVTSFIEYNHVFRRRVTAGSPTAYRANLTGAGMIWTTSEVLSWEGIGASAWFDLDPSSQWHKDKPRVLSAYGQKTEISYSYTEIVTASSLFYRAYNNAILVL